MRYDEIIASNLIALLFVMQCIILPCFQGLFESTQGYDHVYFNESYDSFLVLLPRWNGDY